MIIRIAFKVKAPVGIAAGRGFPFGNDVIGMAGVRVRADSFFDRIILEMRLESQKTGQKARLAASDHFDDHE